MGWTIPEREFRHFVLPLRVNNEDLDSARVVFYRMLKPRVEGLSMEDAILEVNHWCHEMMTYQPSDGRTHAPLASLKNSRADAARNPPSAWPPSAAWASRPARCTPRAGPTPRAITPG